MRKALLSSTVLLLALGIGCGGGHIGAGAVVPTKFTAGIAHVAGSYGFTQDNYLVEGAQKISQLGSNSIFVYLTPWFRSQYPDQSAHAWPVSNPAKCRLTRADQSF